MQVLPKSIINISKLDILVFVWNSLKFALKPLCVWHQSHFVHFSQTFWWNGMDNLNAALDYWHAPSMGCQRRPLKG